MSLSDAKIRSIKPLDKPFKLTESHGLYLLVNPGGSRLWYLKYRFNRKESRIALGAYLQVSLSDARQQRDGIRKLLAQNNSAWLIKPPLHRKNALKPWRWHGTKPTKNGQLTMQSASLPV